MAKASMHPTIAKIQAAMESTVEQPSEIRSADMVELCRQCGADDAGLISIERQELDDQREHILRYAPWTKSLLAFVCRMNREPIRSPARSISNLEFHTAGDATNEVAREVVRRLERFGIRAINPSIGFPMELDEFPDRIWVVSHKPVAVAAGLGQIGIHRNVIHPRFGNFILLGTVLLDYELNQKREEEAAPIDYNPCLECKLCVAACPVGAISPQGDFNFNACYTHNYREFMGGFTDWAEQLAASSSRNDYRSRFTDAESASMWASLSFGANYKAAYCLAVCPAGEEVIRPWLNDRKNFTDQILRPLQEKSEDVYVIPGSDAEQHVARRFPNKSVRRVRGSLHPKSIETFLKYLPLQFQAGQAKDLNAVYHFTFTGLEARQATVWIADQKLKVQDGLHDVANLKIIADSHTWVRFLKREVTLLWALMTLRLRLWGSPLWLLKFGKCFPS